MARQVYPPNVNEASEKPDSRRLLSGLVAQRFDVGDYLGGVLV